MQCTSISEAGPSLSLCCDPHSNTLFKTPSSLDATFVEWKSRVFFSGARATQDADYSDGRRREEEEKARKWHKWPHYFLPLSLSLSLRAAVFEPLAPKRGEDGTETERDRSPCNRTRQLTDVKQG